MRPFSPRVTLAVTATEPSYWPTSFTLAKYGLHFETHVIQVSVVPCCGCCGVVDKHIDGPRQITGKKQFGWLCVMKCGPEKAFISGYFEPEFYVYNIYKLLQLKQNTLLSVTKTNLLKTDKQIVTVHCESHMKPINTTSE
jgi:hypothetical protein